MDDLINYIKNCIRPKNDNEFILNYKDDNFKHVNLVQDAIFCTKEIPTIPKAEYILINDTYICRNIVSDAGTRNIEWLDENTGGFTWETTDVPIYRRLLPPPYETLDHTFIISTVVYEYKKREEIHYVEYGVRTGENLKNIARFSKKAYGIDIDILDSLRKEISKNVNIQLYNCITDDYSENILPNIYYNVAFIDADHSSESAFKDFNYLFRYLKVGGYIFLHDTYPCSPEFLKKDACNDCYKTPLLIKKNYKVNIELEILTLPLNPGLTIVRKLI